MQVLNIHQREYSASFTGVGELLDSLSSRHDRLWPYYLWPKMKFDKALSVGAAGGHGPIRYEVEEYSPGQSIKFRFTGPIGFNGYHGYHIQQTDTGNVTLTHKLAMQTSGMALLTWPLIYRPLHDALTEDSLTFAETQLGIKQTIVNWSVWVKILRCLVTVGKAKRQNFK